jgi:integrase
LLLAAAKYNLKLAALLGTRRLIDRIDQTGKGTVAEWIPEFRKILARRDLAPNTVKTNEWKLRQIEAGLGALLMHCVETKHLADFLEPWIEDGKDRSVVSLRSMLDDVFRTAAGKGWVKANPVEALAKHSATVKRGRLSLEHFLAIYAQAQASEDPWVANMMALAIVSAQPRECLVSWEFSDEHDGFLWNERGKTGAKIKLPAALTIPELGWRLDDTIRRCRDTVLSKHMLHHTRKYAYNRRGGPIFIDTATKAFARARDATAGLEWSGKEPPTLHEIRSLALRLYKDELGRDFAQALAGHKEGSTTDIYTDVRGSEWIEVKVR